MSGTQQQVVSPTPPNEITAITELQPTDTVLLVRGNNVFQILFGQLTAAALPLSGGEISGSLSVASAPAQENDVVRLQDLAQAMSTSGLASYATKAQTAATNAENSAQGAANAAATAVSGQKGAPLGVVPLDVNGAAMLSGQSVLQHDAATGVLTLNVAGLKVAFGVGNDPGASGQIWADDSGYLRYSIGPAT